MEFVVFNQQDKKNELETSEFLSLHSVLRQRILNDNKR